MDLLRKKTNAPIFSMPVKKLDFNLSILLELLDEFIDWFPSNDLKPFLEDYCKNYSHEYLQFCDFSKQEKERGVTYTLSNHPVPFVFSEKRSFN